jgi:hypothetical protein
MKRLGRRREYDQKQQRFGVTESAGAAALALAAGGAMIGSKLAGRP